MNLKQSYSAILLSGLLGSIPTVVVANEIQTEYSYLEKQVVDWEEELKSVTDKQKIIDYKFLLAEAYANLGNYPKAKKELEDIKNLDNGAKQLSLVLEKQGNIEISIGNLDKGIFLYLKSIQQGRTSISVLNNLVESLKKRKRNLEFNQSQSRRAEDGKNYVKEIARDKELIEKYSKLAMLAIDLRRDGTTEEVKIDPQKKERLSSTIALIEWNANGNTLSQEQINQGSKIVGDLPATRKLVFTLIAWSKIDAKNQDAWLFKGIETAKQINDLYAQSYAETALAEFYLKTSQIEKAISTVLASQNIAQSIFAYDSLFHSQSLAGEIYQQMGYKERAIDAYRGAIASLDNSFEYVRTADLKTELEPVYQNALKLLLESENPSQDNLTEAINISDKIRLLQLRKYFGDDCFELISNSDRTSKKRSERTAIINSIILDDRTHFIVEMPNGKKNHNAIKIEKKRLVKSAESWRKQLTIGYRWEFQKNSRLFYEMIIKPFEVKLEKNKIEKIVFIHDGILRNLPMAALYDGEKYLVERWETVSSLGLQVSHEERQKIEEVLAFGLENPSPNFSAWGNLENAIKEIQIITELVEGKTYANREFTSSNLLKQIKEKEYSILHLATHGYFSGNAATSFLLASNGKITALELEQILKQSKQTLELLVLSACETAVGSEESLLGLAGIAARSGVKSVLGSLWQVDDESQLELIEAFYQEKASDNTKSSTALAKAQRDEIARLSHPREWAATILIE